jgi:hypothetical protein
MMYRKIKKNSGKLRLQSTHAFSAYMTALTEKPSAPFERA